jgi:hypothetical protein
MNSITPMPAIVRAAQVLVDYESDELDLSDRAMCAFAIMFRTLPVVTSTAARCSVSFTALAAHMRGWRWALAHGARSIGAVQPERVRFCTLRCTCGVRSVAHGAPVNEPATQRCAL